LKKVVFGQQEAGSGKHFLFRKNFQQAGGFLCIIMIKDISKNIFQVAPSF